LPFLNTLLQLADFIDNGTQQQKAQLPLSRIKRVMRADDTVAMIGVQQH